MEHTKDNDINGRAGIKLVIKISALNYGSAIKTLIPHVFLEALKVKRMKTFMEVLCAYPETTVTALIAALNILPQNTKNMLTVRAINEFESDLKFLLMSLASKEDMNITINTINADTYQDNIEISFHININDYISIIEKITRVNRDLHLYNYEGSRLDDGKAWSFLSIINSENLGSKSKMQQIFNKTAWSAAKLAITVYPKRKKDEFIVSAVNANKLELAKLIEVIIERKGIELNIDSISAETPPI